ncbi:ankyrin repeat-containing domain protein [Aspergillus avenaceus]|uniref:Ankyrin repeat-containing domain protein n=1 Tax=Aspergillus avenaceus TaxID=36643 RepID=A0A5N6U1J7_ASPAV|nr:ankyrin repeat-containing domain protein [Aspergillus avenaceus]
MSIQLPVDSIDDLIYDARAGDLEALKSDLAALSTAHSSSEASIIASAIDASPAEEGGTGSCLLHFPAANGNEEILNYLLQVLTLEKEKVEAVINHRNYSGNTALHWAALNTHLGCVKALVEAGADISIKNDAGLDAVFLAERADWSAAGPGEEGDEEEAEAQAEGDAPMTKGRQVVEWLLGSEKGGELENGVAQDAGEGSSSVNADAK